MFDQPDPFGPAKIELAAKSASSSTTSGLKPDLNRPKEPLEAFPLESLKMVGVLQQKNTNFALIKADTGLYRVKVGNYMGQNFGIVTPDQRQPDPAARADPGRRGRLDRAPEHAAIAG